tara:strand:+ start:807 stop:1118 length:312 start_codon:yes stop_codon:yes gene_type:complete
MAPVLYSDYNVWGALAVETAKQLINIRPSLSTNKIVDKVVDYWFEDWVSWKAERAMRSVDRQTKEINESLDAAAKPKTLFTETKEGETPLGGEMRIRSHWVDK